MTDLSDQFKDVKIDGKDEINEMSAVNGKEKRRVILNELNRTIPDELKEYSRNFNRSFQDLNLREETLYRISNYSSNLFSKNVETSQKYRKMGNELYSAERYKEALDAYNQALFYAPLNYSLAEDESNIDYALCLANRCAAFLQLKLFRDCLTDIDLAIKYNYPESKRKKLEERKRFCLEQLKIDSKSNDELKENSNNDIIARELINLTSSKVNQWNDTVVAVQDLNPGDILLEEKAYCKTLVKSKYYERCFNCLKKTGIYIHPCRSCSQVKFCSEKCSEDAWSNGHYLECNRIAMLDLFKANYSLESIQIALKCLIKSDLDQVFNELRSIEQEPKALFSNILNNLKQKINFKEEDYESVAQIMIYLVDQYQIPKRLIKSSTDNPADIELFGAILSRLLNKLQKNIVSILLRDLKVLELRNCPHSQIYQAFEEEEFGRAIFLTYNQLEHDLVPNCQILRFTDDKLIISALKEIKNGEKLSINKNLNDFADNNVFSNQNLLLDPSLQLNMYRENKSKYLKLMYRYGFKCIKCSDGPMLIFNEISMFYVECLKCEYNEQIERPENEEDKKDEKDSNILDQIQELINVRDFCVKQGRKTRLLLYSKQPELRTIEHNLLDSYRDLKTRLYPTNLCIAEIEFDLAICYIQMRMYVRAVKHAMNAINSWRSHFTSNEIQYLNGLVKLINIQYYFVKHINTTSKELDQEHITLYKYHMNDLKENLEFLIENKEKFFGDRAIQQNLFERFNEKLSTIQQFKTK